MAYTLNGSQLASGTPRYAAAKFNDGIIIEEGTTNLLTANQASVETNLTGLGASSDGGWPTFTRDTATGWSGSASAKAVVAFTPGTWINIFTPGGTSGVAVAPNTYYTFSVWVRTSPARNLVVQLLWYDSSGTYLSSSNGPATAGSPSWTRFIVTGQSPATAAYCQVAVSMFGGSMGDAMWWDGAQLEQKAYATTFQLPALVRIAETLTIPQAQTTPGTGTWEGWVSLLRAPGMQVQYILDLNGSANQSLKLYVTPAGVLECAYGTGSTTVAVTGTNALVANTLYHIAVTWDASSGVVVYRSGLPEGSSPALPSLAPGSPVYLASASSGTLQLDGILDDVTVLSYAKDGTAISADATAGSAMGLVGGANVYLPFDDTLSAFGWPPPTPTPTPTPTTTPTFTATPTPTVTPTPTITPTPTVTPTVTPTYTPTNTPVPTSCVGWYVAGTGADATGIGTVAWANPGNITAVDSTGATVTLASLAYSHWLRATNFHFNIPSGATIRGIQVSVRVKYTGTGSGTEQHCKLYRGGFVGTDEGGGTGIPSTSYTYINYGSSTDLWGLSDWTPAQINASTFGVGWGSRGTASSVVHDVDAVRITVCYSQ